MRRLLMIAAATAFAASAAFAQGPGYGPGPGKGPGKGPGWSFNGDNTRGWPMMSRDERNQHRSRMLSMKSYEECVAYLASIRMKQAGRFG